MRKIRSGTGVEEFCSFVVPGSAVINLQRNSYKQACVYRGEGRGERDNALNDFSLQGMYKGSWPIADKERGILLLRLTIIYKIVSIQLY